MGSGAKSPTVHAVCGLPASGKTTLARHLEEEHEAVRFSADDWVKRLYGPEVPVEHFPRHRHRVWETAWGVARQLLERGVDVVLDFSFWHRFERDQYRKRAEDLGAAFRMYYLDCPEEECRARLAARNEAHPPPVFQIDDDAFDVLWASFEPPEEDEDLIVVDATQPVSELGVGSPSP